MTKLENGSPTLIKYNGIMYWLYNPDSKYDLYMIPVQVIITDMQITNQTGACNPN